MRRIWCEFRSPEELCAPFVAKTLAHYGVALNYKVEYGRIDENLFAMLRHFNGEGVPVSLWLTLPDEQGYWINERNCVEFQLYVEDVLERLAKEHLKIRGICVDMEPPLAMVRAVTGEFGLFRKWLNMLKLVTINMNPIRYRRSEEVFKAVAHSLSVHGLEGMGVGMHEVIADLNRKYPWAQNAAETPILDVPWTLHNFMFYATMLRQWRKGPGDPAEAVNRTIREEIQQLQKRFGDRLAISVGVTNVGKMGNEAHYESAEEMRPDLELVKSLGIKDLSLFGLDGLMEEEKLNAYLGVFSEYVDR